jgi:putative transposase
VLTTETDDGQDEFDTSNLDVVEILLYTALLSLLVSRDLLDLITKQADDEIVFPPEHWAATFRTHAQLILHELGEYLGYSPPPLLERLINDAQKNHRQWPILQETLATATQPRCESYIKTNARLAGCLTQPKSSPRLDTES